MQGAALDIDLGHAQRLGNIPYEAVAAAGIKAGFKKPALELPCDLVEMQRDLSGRRAGASVFRAATMVSVIAHFAVLLYVMLAPSNESFGVGGDAPEGVGVEIISGVAFEALFARPDSGGGAAQSVDIVADTATVEEQSEQLPQSATRGIPSKPPEVLVTPDNERAVETDTMVEDPRKPADSRVEDMAKPQEIEQKPPVEARAATVASAASASSSTSVSGSDGQAAASTGKANRYAMEIRAALGRTRPKHAGIRGNVWIKFAIDKEGEVAFAEVSRSSGSQRLDKLALESIRAARLPSPPPSLSDLQRTYVIPFEFR